MFYWASRIFGTEFNTMELPYLGASILMLHYYGNLCKQIALVFTELEVPQFLRELPSLRNAPRGFNLFEAIIVLLG